MPAPPPAIPPVIIVQRRVHAAVVVEQMPTRVIITASTPRKGNDLELSPDQEIPESHGRKA
jgi:hypothetical protein